MAQPTQSKQPRTIQISLRTAALSALALILLGATAGVLADKVKVSPGDYRDKEPKASATSLLTSARATLEKDESWERIAIGQILYLSGQEAEAEALWDSIRKPEPGDWIRIGRVLYRAGEWDRAKEYFDRVVKAKPKDEDWLAEIGMYYNLQGDRDTAESLFDRSFREDPDNLYNILKAAGSYLGVEER
ncbi:MAG: tetratricopeptide repeat protein [Thermoanaerobaculia bacterium]|nr:tetratricopeptide repeat protein [Thermoanaerobaculia bacterium]